jgi:hypothetical protein
MLFPGAAEAASRTPYISAKPFHEVEHSHARSTLAPTKLEEIDADRIALSKYFRLVSLRIMLIVVIDARLDFCFSLLG